MNAGPGEKQPKMRDIKNVICYLRNDRKPITLLIAFFAY
jgi:hypothetical protein